jgi:hypothetical protein
LQRLLCSCILRRCTCCKTFRVFQLFRFYHTFDIRLDWLDWKTNWLGMLCMLFGRGRFGIPQEHMENKRFAHRHFDNILLGMLCIELHWSILCRSNIFQRHKPCNRFVKFGRWHWTIFLQNNLGTGHLKSFHGDWNIYRLDIILHIGHPT